MSYASSSSSSSSCKLILYFPRVGLTRWVRVTPHGDARDVEEFVLLIWFFFSFFFSFFFVVASSSSSSSCKLILYFPRVGLTRWVRVNPHGDARDAEEFVLLIVFFFFFSLFVCFFFLLLRANLGSTLFSSSLVLFYFRRRRISRRREVTSRLRKRMGILQPSPLLICSIPLVVWMCSSSVFSS